MRAVVLALLLGACQASEREYTGGPGPGPGPGVGGTGGADARGIDGAGGDGGLGGDAAEGAIRVSLCRLADLRGFCGVWGSDALEVRVGGGAPATVTSTFTVTPPPSGAVEVTLSDPMGIFYGAAFRVSAGSPDLTVGVMDVDDLDAVFTASSIPPRQSGIGVTVLAIDDPGGAPALGATVGVAGASDPWYATAEPAVFLPTAPTDASGVAAYFDLVPGDTTTTVSHMGGAPRNLTIFAVADSLVVLRVQL